MVEKFGKRGFVVVGVTSEPKAPTVKYMEETGWKAIAVIEKSGATMKSYAFKGYPSAALVNPKGEVVWTGHPGNLKDGDIEKNLVGVKMRSKSSGTLCVDVELPRKYKGIVKKLASGRVGDGWKALKVAARKCSQEDRQGIELAIAAVDELAAGELARAQEASTSGRWFDAQECWKRVAKHLAGHEAGTTAKGQLKILKKKKSLKPEIEAGKRIARAQKEIQGEQINKAKQTLTSVTSGYLKNTKEAHRAATLLEEISR